MVIYEFIICGKVHEERGIEWVRISCGGPPVVGNLSLEVTCVAQTSKKIYPLHQHQKKYPRIKNKKQNKKTVKLLDSILRCMISFTKSDHSL